MLTRTFLLAIVVLVWALPGRASQTFLSDIDWWPHNNTLGPNAPVILGFNLLSSTPKAREETAVFHGIRHRYAVFLVAHREVIRLKVSDIHYELDNYAQVILHPEHPLTLGKHYHLVIRYLSDTHLQLGDYNTFMGWTRPEWIIANSSNTADSLQWQEKPSFQSSIIDKELNWPVVRYSYKTQAANGASVALRVWWRKAREKNWHYYYFTSNRYQGRLLIGKDMRDLTAYSKLQINTQYEATFDLLDAFGNELKWAGPPIAFTTDWLR